jgi:hypothetical protein
MKEKDKAQYQSEAKQKELASKRMVTEDAYAAAVEIENLNKMEDTVAARSVEEAIQALSMSDPGSADRHPEK